MFNDLKRRYPKYFIIEGGKETSFFNLIDDDSDKEDNKGEERKENLSDDRSQDEIEYNKTGKSDD